MELVYTAIEAARLWGFDDSTVRKACIAGKFDDSECRKSCGTWLVSHVGMVRVYGQPPAQDK